MGVLMLFPQAMFPNSQIAGLEWLLPITIIALAWSDIMLAALAYRHDVGATSVPARRRAVDDQHRRFRLVVHLDSATASSSPMCCRWSARWSPRDPVPQELRPAARLEPDPATLWRMARRNLPVAAADAVEWGSRRVDIAILGLFFRRTSSASIMSRRTSRRCRPS
jgi:hypothetical protein